MSACMKTSCELCAAASNMQEWEFRNPAAPKGQQGCKLSNIEKHQGFEEMVPRVVWIKHQRIKARGGLFKQFYFEDWTELVHPKDMTNLEALMKFLSGFAGYVRTAKMVCHTLSILSLLDPFGSFWIFWFVEPIHSQNRGNSKWESSMVFVAVICIYNLDCDAW